MLKLWTDLFMLAIEVQQVIWLRSTKLMLGGAAAEREVKLMVSEKIAAATEAGLSLAVGNSIATVAKGYRKKVRANRRRLSR
jgi:hypothetical protein